MLLGPTTPSNRLTKPADYVSLLLIDIEVGSDQEEDTKSEMRFGSTHLATALSSSGPATEAASENALGQADAEEEEGVEEGRQAKPRSGTELLGSWHDYHCA